MVRAHRRRGNNDNLLIGNDFSYAAAHGIEMTFSSVGRVIDPTFRITRAARGCRVDDPTYSLYSNPAPGYA